MGDRGRQGRRRLGTRPDGTVLALTSRKLRRVNDATLRRLNLIRAVAVVDALLLVVLLIAAVNDAEGAVNCLGPLHGVGFLALVFMCLRGAGEGRCGWWFPAIVVATLGPPGSLIGDLKIRKQLR